jgi:hypothetical protein
MLQNEDQLTNLDLEMDGEAKQNLANAAYWGKFISIFFICIAGFAILMFTIVSAAFMNGFKNAFGERYGYFSGYGGSAIIAMLIFVLLVFGIIYYFLLNFSLKTKQALVTENIDTLNKGLSSLKIYFIIMSVIGILTLLSSLYNFVAIFNF